MKMCNTCGEKPAAPKRGQCSTCSNAKRNKRYREDAEFREAKKRQDAQYYKENRSTALERMRQYREDHKDELSEYYKAYRAINAERIRERNKERNSTPEGKESNRDRGLRWRYNLSLEEYSAMMAAQEGRCWICQSSDRLLEVDHDHESGEVRGLLCGKCNRAIGLLDERVEVVQRAALYLNSNIRTQV